MYSQTPAHRANVDLSFALLCNVARHRLFSLKSEPATIQAPVSAAVHGYEWQRNSVMGLVGRLGHAPQLPHLEVCVVVGVRRWIFIPVPSVPSHPTCIGLPDEECTR